MHLTLIRHYRSPQLVHSHILLDGRPLGEGRETRYIGQRPLAEVLPPGEYRLQPAGTQLSPMTLRIVRHRGQARVHIGGTPLRQWMDGWILIGQPDFPCLPPEERRLTDQSRTFERLQERVYQAWAEQEDMTLTIQDEEPEK